MKYFLICRLSNFLQKELMLPQNNLKESVEFDGSQRVNCKPQIVWAKPYLNGGICRPCSAKCPIRAKCSSPAIAFVWRHIGSFVKGRLRCIDCHLVFIFKIQTWKNIRYSISSPCSDSYPRFYVSFDSLPGPLSTLSTGPIGLDLVSVFLMITSCSRPRATTCRRRSDGGQGGSACTIPDKVTAT
jgi:hypothetical protein